MTPQTRARLLADTVCGIYGLSEAATKVARQSAAKRATKACAIYEAILRSFRCCSELAPDQAKGCEEQT